MLKSKQLSMDNVESHANLGDSQTGNGTPGCNDRVEPDG